MSNTTGMSAGRPSARTGAAASNLQSIIGGDDEDKLGRVNFEIPESKRTAFKIYAATQKKSMGEILAEHINTCSTGAERTAEGAEASPRPPSIRPWALIASERRWRLQSGRIDLVQVHRGYPPIRHRQLRGN